MTDVLATAADESYGYHALNLVGSVKRNSDVFDRIEVFDLGLSPHQLQLLGSVDRVVVREVPPFVPHWSQCFTWKPWAWTQIQADRAFWIDAGASVLRSLSPALEQVAELGYFVVSQGGRLDDILPPDYFEDYDLPKAYSGSPYVAAGILGFRSAGEFFRGVVIPTYEDCIAGRNLGFSPAELRSKNRGIGYMPFPPIRDCPAFRWDQSILNAHFFQTMIDATIADVDIYAAWRSAKDHPAQVIWHHRRPADLRFLKHVPYTNARARRRAWSAWWRVRWRLKLRRLHLRAKKRVLQARAFTGRDGPSNDQLFGGEARGRHRDERVER